MAGDVKFIRVHGRVVPVRGKGSAPKGVSKRYGAKREKPKAKSLGAAKGALIGAGAAMAGFQAKDLFNEAVHAAKDAKHGLSVIGKPKNVLTAKQFAKGTAKMAVIGGAIGAAIGSLKFYKAGKGESDKQLAARAGGIKKKKRK